MKIHGLTHLALSVRDPDVSARFYEQAFGAREYYRDENSVQVQGPGPHDVMAFERDPKQAGKAGGILHFGFRLVSAEDIDSVVNQALRAGGRLLRRGEFSPGFPYAYIADPDGYEIEIWYE